MSEAIVVIESDGSLAIAIVKSGYGDVVVEVLAAVFQLLAAMAEQTLNGRFVLEYDVDVAGRVALLGFARDARMLQVLARNLELDLAVLVEHLEQALLVDVPGQTAEEDFARVDRVEGVDFGWQAAAPGHVSRGVVVVEVALLIVVVAFVVWLG